MVVVFEIFEAFTGFEAFEVFDIVAPPALTSLGKLRLTPATCGPNNELL